MLEENLVELWLGYEFFWPILEGCIGYKRLQNNIKEQFWLRFRHSAKFTPSLVKCRQRRRVSVLIMSKFNQSFSVVIFICLAWISQELNIGKMAEVHSCGSCCQPLIIFNKKVFISSVDVTGQNAGEPGFTSQVSVNISQYILIK